MDTEVIVAIVGGLLTLVNTIVGIAITNLFKAHLAIQSALTQNQSDIRINAVHLDHLTKTLEDHTDSDRQSFEQVRDQQAAHHQDNLRLMQDIQVSLRQMQSRKYDARGA